MLFAKMTNELEPKAADDELDEEGTKYSCIISSSLTENVWYIRMKSFFVQMIASLSSFVSCVSLRDDVTLYEVSEVYWYKNSLPATERNGRKDAFICYFDFAYQKTL